MSKLQRTTHIAGLGTFGWGFVPKLHQACNELQVTAAISSMGVIDLNRATFNTPTRFGGDGLVDVSPHPRQIKNAIGHAGSDEQALLNRDNWAPLTGQMLDKIIQRNHKLGLVDAQGLVVQGVSTGHGEVTGRFLRDWKSRRPRDFV